MFHILLNLETILTLIYISVPRYSRENSRITFPILNQLFGQGSICQISHKMVDRKESSQPSHKIYEYWKYVLVSFLMKMKRDFLK